MPHLDKFPKLGYQEQVICSHLSDGSEPSWLEPELKDFQLGSARGLFPSARNCFFQLEKLFFVLLIFGRPGTLFSPLSVVNNTFPS